MLEGLIQYKKAHGEEQESMSFECKTLPREGEFIKWDTQKAFLVKHVYHIPKVIDQVKQDDHYDFIVFGEFVEDLSVSKI